MTPIAQIVRAGPEGALLWVVIIVASIIAQIVKARRQTTQTTHPTPPAVPPTAPRSSTTPHATEPPDQLREFLESLTQGQASPQPPPVQPPAPRAPTGRKHTRQPAPRPASVRTSALTSPRKQVRRTTPPAPIGRARPATPPPVRSAQRPAPRPAKPVPQPPPRPAATVAAAYAAEPGITTTKFGGETRARDFRISVAAQLLNPAVLRRSIVVREILGPPLAIRRTKGL